MKLYSRLACTQKRQKCKFVPRLLPMIVDILVTNSTPLIVVECTNMFVCCNAQKFKDVYVRVHTECMYGLCIIFALISKFFILEMLRKVKLYNKETALCPGNMYYTANISIWIPMAIRS